MFRNVQCGKHIYWLFGRTLDANIISKRSAICINSYRVILSEHEHNSTWLSFEFHFRQNQYPHTQRERDNNKANVSSTSLNFAHNVMCCGQAHPMTVPFHQPSADCEWQKWKTQLKILNWEWKKGKFYMHESLKNSFDESSLSTKLKCQYCVNRSCWTMNGGMGAKTNSIYPK